jgi:NADPH:quinone reductase-like Zn-dependent oxidoreductase
MQAIVYDKYGSVDNLAAREVDMPIPGTGEVRIRVHAASVNSWDWDLVQGRPWIVRIAGGFLKPKYRILGCDVAGTVDAVGEGVTEFKTGDMVFGDISGSGWGAFAEYVCAKAAVLAQKPEGMEFEDAAALPQAGVLAYQGLYTRKILGVGQQMLINGAGGGVGTLAIQMAKADGVGVTAVDHPDKLDMLRSLGADHVIDYTAEDYTRTGKQYDLILDVTARRRISDYKRSLKPGGALIVVGGATSLIFSLLLFGSRSGRSEGKTLGLLMHRPSRTDLEKLTGLYLNGILKPVIDRTYALHEVPQAIQYLGAGKAKGKLVVGIIGGSEEGRKKEVKK